MENTISVEQGKDDAPPSGSGSPSPTPSTTTGVSVATLPSPPPPPAAPTQPAVVAAGCPPGGASTTEGGGNETLAAERAVLGAILKESDAAADRVAALATEDFFWQQPRAVLRGLRELVEQGRQPNQTILLEHLRASGQLGAAGGESFVADLPKAATGAATFDGCLAELRLCADRRELATIGASITAASRPSGVRNVDFHRAIELLEQRLNGRGVTNFKDELQKRRFALDKPPPIITPRFCVAGVPVCTPGNLTAISAPRKEGKSGFVGAMIAASMTLTPDTVDCLGVTSRNPAGGALIHLDTEQSPRDHYDLICRSLRRANIAAPPDWLLSYCLTGLEPQRVQKALVMVMRDAAKRFGSVHAVLLDGVADLVADVNDAKESNGLVTQLHALAIEFDCSIIGVIHLNPGNSDKTRGHLGSQLERKTEANLKLERKDGKTVVWADRNRRAPIPMESGPCFIWSDEAEMHISTGALGRLKQEVKRGHLRELAEAVMNASGNGRLSWKGFHAGIAEADGLSAGGARKKFAAMLDHGVIEKDDERQYHLVP